MKVNIKNGELTNGMNGLGDCVVDMTSEEFEYATNCPLEERIEIIRDKLSEVLETPQKTPDLMYLVGNDII